MKLYAGKVQHHLSISIFISSLLFLAIFAGLANAQTNQNTPARGVHSGMSYSISDIETINQQSGNLMLNVPLGSLPAGRGGLSAGVSLHYNSKLWDSFVRELVETSTDRLILSKDGGWKYGYKYRLKFDERMGPRCQDAADYPIQFSVVFPDGSQHALQLAGYSAGGFLNVYPDGTNACADPPPPSPAPAILNYFTVDGTYLRLEYHQDAVGDYEDNAFTLYLPDGSKVERFAAGSAGNVEQRISDRNGNFIEYIENATDAAYGNHQTTHIRDQLGRKIVIEYNAAPDQDWIHSKGFDGASVTTKVKWRQIAVRRTYNACLNGLEPNCGNQSVNKALWVVDKIHLPSQIDGNLYYSFDYNADATSNPSPGWGELTEVKLPSGAKSNYTYTNGAITASVLRIRPAQKTLTYTEQHDGTNQQRTETWTYSVTYREPSQEQVTSATTTAPNGATTTEYYYQEAYTPGYYLNDVYKVGQPDGTIVERYYENSFPLNTAVSFRSNSFVRYEFTSIRDTANNLVKTAIKEFSYDKNGNQTSVKEYDFVPYWSVPRDSGGKPTGLPANAATYLKRITRTDYYNPAPAFDSADYTNVNIYALAGSPRLRNLVKSVEVQNGAGVPQSRTEMFYDYTAYSGNTKGGNLTETKAWDSWKNGAAQAYSNPLTVSNSVSTTVQYNSYGSPTLTTDARGVQTQITYGSISTGSGTVSDLYPTQTISAYGTAIAQTSQAVFDFHTGLVKQTTILGHNANENVVSESVYDALGRPTLAKTAVGKAEEIWTETIYNDADRRVIAKADLFAKGDGRKVSIQHYDQLGRVRLTRTLEDALSQDPLNEQHGIKVQTRYLTSGNHTYQLTSNPYRAGYSSSAGSEATMGWTRSKADNVGKHSEVETFSGATLPAPWGTNSASTGVVTTDRDAERTLVTDQAGRKRISQSNALGQLLKVWEIKDADADTESISFGSPVLNLHGLVTSYAYDTLSNLTTVNQGGQTRSFAYSSLSSLKSATKPEMGTTPTNGTIVYKYDSNGNLLTKTDPRNVTTTYTYDQLNRVLTRTYSGEVGAVTPAVNYSYDGTGLAQVPAYSKGKLTKVASAVSETKYTAFDVFGRVLANEQVTDNQTYPFTYSYNLSGALTAEKYPSGRTVRNNFDVDGDLAAVSSRSKAIAPMMLYANNFTYTAAGAVSAMQLGNGRWETTQFNARLQPTQLGLGTTNNAANPDLWKVSFAYGTTQNNGNVVSQTITVPSVGAAQGFTAIQNYEYDNLNRLQRAWETINSAETWRQTYQFDRFGNRKFNLSQTTTPATPADGAPKVINPEPDTNTNRLKQTQYGEANAYLYDAAGNLTQDASGRRFAYDGENKQKEFFDWNNGTSTPNATYHYDGDGKRVKKVVGTETTIFIYDASGKLAAEYSTTVTPPAQAKTSYLTNDHLGSPRVITDQAGTVTSRRDFLPFGEEIGVTAPTTTGRNNHPQYISDTVRQKFTGYERDTESNLEYAKARMYGGSHGRFTSPDPLLSSGRPNSPQSWNRYTYVLNNPLVSVDPTGLWEWSAALGGSDDNDTLKKKRKAAEKAGNDAEYKRLDGILTKRQQFVDGLAKAKANAEKITNKAERNAVKATLEMYGKPMDGNNVTVAQRDPSSGSGAAFTKFEDGRVIVAFAEREFSQASLFVSIAHESYHVGNIYSDINESMSTQGMCSNTAMFSTSIHETEKGAYRVSSLIAQASGEGNLTLSSSRGGTVLWNTAWASLDSRTIEANRSSAIETHLSNLGIGENDQRGQRVAFPGGGKWQ